MVGRLLPYPYQARNKVATSCLRQDVHSATIHLLEGRLRVEIANHRYSCGRGTQQHGQGSGLASLNGKHLHSRHYTAISQTCASNKKILTSIERHAIAEGVSPCHLATIIILKQCSGAISINTSQ